MRTATFVILILSFAASLYSQKAQPNQASEPGRKSETTTKAPGTAAAGVAQQEEDDEKGPWKALKYRLIGPFRGGRVVAVSGVLGQDNVYYFGAVAGGVWKTTDGGLNWKPIFDKQKDASPSLGAIAVSESDPTTIYVGTGEACIRGYLVGGKGVYKSIVA